MYTYITHICIKNQITSYLHYWAPLVLIKGAMISQITTVALSGWAWVMLRFRHWVNLTQSACMNRYQKETTDLIYNAVALLVNCLDSLINTKYFYTHIEWGRRRMWEISPVFSAHDALMYVHVKHIFKFNLLYAIYKKIFSHRCF